MAILRKHPTSTRTPPLQTAKLAKKLLSPKRTTRKLKQAATEKPSKAKATHSAPSSPQRTASPVPMEVVSENGQQAQEDQQMIDAAAVPQQQQQSVEVQPQQPPSTYTPAEQKMIDTINSVASKIEQFARELPTLQGQINNHRTRLCLFKWHPKTFSFNAEKLNRSQKQLHYAAGMVDENVLQQIFRLDSIQTENDAIRKLRKATVQKGNETIKAAIALRERTEKLQRFVPAWQPEEEKPVPMEDVSPAPAKQPETKPQQQQQKQQQEASESSDDDEDSKMEDVQPAVPKSKSPAPTAKSPAPKSPTQKSTAAPTLTPLQQKYEQLDLPTYAGPAFHARVHPHSGSLLIEGDMEGIKSDDISVTPDHKNRTLTIRGVRLPERRRSVPQSFGFFGLPQQRIQPFGHFKKVIDLDELDPHGVLDLAGLQAVIDPRQQQLQITLPRAKPTVRPATQQTVRTARPIFQPPQPQRRPVQHSTGFSYSSDEEDEYSHPYTSSSFAAPSYHRQPAYPPYRRVAAPSFFSGPAGFW